jgi:hypothetical protein
MYVFILFRVDVFGFSYAVMTAALTVSAAVIYYTIIRPRLGW